MWCFCEFTLQLTWFLRKQILFIFPHKQHSNIDLQYICDFQNCCKVRLRCVCTPLADSRWCYPHLLWKPSRSSFFSNSTILILFISSISMNLNGTKIVIYFQVLLFIVKLSSFYSYFYAFLCVLTSRTLTHYVFPYYI